MLDAVQRSTDLPYPTLWGWWSVLFGAMDGTLLLSLFFSLSEFMLCLLVAIDRLWAISQKLHRKRLHLLHDDTAFSASVQFWHLIDILLLVWTGSWSNCVLSNPAALGCSWAIVRFLCVSACMLYDHSSCCRNLVISSCNLMLSCSTFEMLKVE